MAQMTGQPTWGGPQAAVSEVVVVTPVPVLGVGRGSWLCCCWPAILSAGCLATKL